MKVSRKDMVEEVVNNLLYQHLCIKHGTVQKFKVMMDCEVYSFSPLKTKSQPKSLIYIQHNINLYYHLLIIVFVWLWCNMPSRDTMH